MNIAKIPQPKHELGESYCSEIASARKCSALLRELGRERREAIQFSSAYRYSMTMLLPSTYPSSRIPWRNASSRRVSDEAEEAVRNPSQGTFVAAAPRREN